MSRSLNRRRRRCCFSLHLLIQNDYYQTSTPCCCLFALKGVQTSSFHFSSFQRRSRRIDSSHVFRILSRWMAGEPDMASSPVGLLEELRTALPIFFFGSRLKTSFCTLAFQRCHSKSMEMVHLCVASIRYIKIDFQQLLREWLPYEHMKVGSIPGNQERM